MFGITCSAVLLTTLLGHCISSSDEDSAELADTPTALRTVLGRLDDLLQTYPTKPAVNNPFLSTEDFAESVVVSGIRFSGDGRRFGLVLQACVVTLPISDCQLPI